jgi:hypothetical protein
MRILTPPTEYVTECGDFQFTGDSHYFGALKSQPKIVSGYPVVPAVEEQSQS